jgi:hypothetical protein
MWIESLLEHVAGGNEECNKDDSAQWLAFISVKNTMGHLLLFLRILESL